MEQKGNEKLSSSSGLFWSPGMCSPVSPPTTCLGGLSHPLVAMETEIHIIFTSCNGVPVSSVFISSGTHHCVLGAVIWTDCWER